MVTSIARAPLAREMRWSNGRLVYARCCRSLDICGSLAQTVPVAEQHALQQINRSKRLKWKTETEVTDDTGPAKPSRKAHLKFSGMDTIVAGNEGVPKIVDAEFLKPVKRAVFEV